MIELTTEQWVLGLFGAFLIGLAKGGLPGVGNLTVGIYAVLFPARASVGILLPILIMGDIVAVIVYRRHARWKTILKLMPWTAFGVILGWLLFGHVSDRQIQVLIGGLLLFMTGLHFLRQALLRREQDRPSSTSEYEQPESKSILHPIVAPVAGVLVGFSTMIANAAGPVSALYFLASGFAKYGFIGTSAWFFFCVNLFKIPFMVDQQVLSFDSLQVSLVLGPAAIAGGLIAPLLVKHINQKWFGGLIWFFIVVAGIGLLVRPDWPTLLFRYVS